MKERRWLFLLVLTAAVCWPIGCGSVRLVRGTDVVPGEASHKDYRTPRWVSHFE